MDAKVKCANCGITITWQPTIVDGRTYCCLGCARGGPCTCDYNHLPQPTDPVSLMLHKRRDDAPPEEQQPGGK